MKRFLPFLIAIPALAQTPAAEYFEKNVRPVFVKNCYGCHGPNRQSAGINFATGAGLDKTTRLLDAISYTADVKMPPTGKLSDEDILTVKKWVESGVAWPRETAAPSPADLQTNHSCRPPILGFPAHQRSHAASVSGKESDRPLHTREARR
jgi:mono/diheme cytochrome c family protein